MPPQSVSDLCAALEEVIAETERMRETLSMSARILRVVKLKLIETEAARKIAEARLAAIQRNQ